MTWMSQGASSCAVIGLPRPGVSADALDANTSATATSRFLRIDMLDLPLVVDRPAGDAIEMLAREGEHRRRLRGLAAMRDDLGARRLHIAAFVPGSALQHRRSTVPAPGHAEAGEGLGQDRLLQRRLAPALAAIGGDHHPGDASRAR